ncbi:MAG: GNAT family N-acetyltransferase [Candidatus Magasanikbacteria bacterium]|nr:GNAT family N-acetyltransferase [Candidatus Magasanikbacteria bacterium]
MEIKSETQTKARAIKLVAEEAGREIGRVYLYILTNDLHAEPFGFLEDLFVEEAYRKSGIGRQLVERAVAEAKQVGCYKLICTSRFGRDHLYAWYEELGFKQHGVEFRMDFDH